MTPEEVGQKLTTMEEAFQKLLTLIDRDGSWISGVMDEVQAAHEAFDDAMWELRYVAYIDESEEDRLNRQYQESMTLPYEL